MFSEITTPFDQMVAGAYGTYADRRKAVIRVIDRGVSLSEVLLADQPWRGIAVEALHGREVGPDGKSVAKHNEVSGKTFHLRTLDGRPITGDGGHFLRGLVKGQKEMDTRATRTLLQRGGDLFIRHQNPSPDIHCDAEMATILLRAWGYRIREPRYWPRRIRKNEHDADGNLVVQLDRWVLYEVGGPFEDEVTTSRRRKKAS